MPLAESDVTTLVTCTLLTFLASAITVVVSVVSGSALAYFARPTAGYWFALTMLLFPFAVGGSVWAYSVMQVAAATGLQCQLVSSSMSARCGALLLFGLARVVPFGAFLCATGLQRSAATIRPYCRTHHLSLAFFLSSAMRRVPTSIVMFLGLFGGATMAAEASLPVYLYKANPGTPPETLNVMLSRLFHENFAMNANALSGTAVLGGAISAALIVAAVVGTLVGRGVLALIQEGLLRSAVSVRHRTAVWLVASVLVFPLSLPGLAVLPGVFLPAVLSGLPILSAIHRAAEYGGILFLGLSVAAVITGGSFVIAVLLRYGRTDWLQRMERSPATAILLLIPAFLPVLCIVAVLGMVTGGRTVGRVGCVAAFLSHASLHYPAFQFIVIALIAAIPEWHVDWQRAVRLRYIFSLSVDGFLRHLAVAIALVGLGMVAVATDGSVSLWFTALFPAPEAALQAAVLGRNASVPDAQAINCSVGAVAVGVSGILASSFVADLKGAADRCVT